MCNLLRVKKTRTTIYHPQSDGMVERLGAMMVAYASEQQRTWDEHLLMMAC